MIARSRNRHCRCRSRNSSARSARNWSNGGPESIALTETGLEVAQRAEHILAATRDLVEFVRHRDLLSGSLRLGIIPTLAPYILPRVLPQLQAEYPNLRLDVRETQTKNLLAELVSGDLDVILLALPADGAELETLRLFDDPFLLAVPATETWPADGLVAMANVDQSRLILLEEGHCLRDQSLAFCAAPRGLAPAGLGATSLATVMQMVANGYGMTLLPTVAADAEARDSRVRLLRFAEPEPARTIGLAWRRTSPRKKDFAALGEVLVRTAGATGRSDRAVNRPIGEARPPRARGSPGYLGVAVSLSSGSTATRAAAKERSMCSRGSAPSRSYGLYLTLSSVSRSPSHPLVSGICRDASQLVGNLRFAPAGSAADAGSPKVVRQAGATGQRAGLIAEARVEVCLIEQTEHNVLLPPLRIDGLAAIEVFQRLFVLAQMPINQAARHKRHRVVFTLESDNLIEIIQRAPRFADVHPRQVAAKISVGVCWIFTYPFIHDAKITLRVRAKYFMCRQKFFRRRWVHHQFGLVTHRLSPQRL